MATQVLGTAVVQDITYTEKQLGSLITITYTNGATAGSEVVTVVDRAITIQIQSGTSTATQVLAAFNASSAAKAIATAAITGTGSNVQLTCVSAFLTGGKAAAKATLTASPLKFTAKSNGGNTTTVKLVGDKTFTVSSVTDGTHLVVADSTGLFAGDTIVQAGHSTTITTVTDGTHLVVGDTTSWTAAAASTAVTAGAEIVGVVSTAITIRIVDGVSTAAQVIAAIVALTASNNLVDMTTDGKSPATPVYIAACSSATNLAGGQSAAAAATLVIQDITLTAATAGVAGNLINLSYTTGATAGSEVVTVSGNAITVQIQSGTSTATQIRAAYDAAGSATALATSSTSGTGSTAQVTVNAAPTTTGEVGVGAENYFVNATATALTASFVWFPFGFVADKMVVNCDETSGAKGVVLSFDGVNSADTVLFGQTSEYKPMKPIRGIWMKYVSAAPSYRVHAWR